MAKCVKRVIESSDNDEYFRVPDALADRAVATGLWDYTSKGAWKANGRSKITDRLPGMDQWQEGFQTAAEIRKEYEANE